MGSNPSLQWLSGLMNYLQEVQLEPEDATQNAISGKNTKSPNYDLKDTIHTGEESEKANEGHLIFPDPKITLLCVQFHICTQLKVTGCKPTH